MDKDREPATSSRVPTISRVIDDTIVELVYDPEERTTAFAIAQSDGQVDLLPEFALRPREVLVPYPPSNTLIAHQAVLFPSRPEPYGTRQDLEQALEAYLRRHVDLPATFLGIAVHYILFSWVYDAFNELPYLRLQGEYGTGKTRGLLTIGLVCYKSFFASGASTVSRSFTFSTRLAALSSLTKPIFASATQPAISSRSSTMAQCEGYRCSAPCRTASGS